MRKKTSGCAVKKGVFLDEAHHSPGEGRKKKKITILVKRKRGVLTSGEGGVTNSSHRKKDAGSQH